MTGGSGRFGGVKVLPRTETMRNADIMDPSTPGRPNTPRDTAVGIFVMAFVLVALVLLVPALIAAFAAAVTGRSVEGELLALVIATADALGPLAPALQIAVSGFAVLMLTLFVEEGLRSTASDKAVRRNVAGFAFWGAIVTTAMSFTAAIAAAIDLSHAGDAVITVGAGAIVLFFAAHVGTRSVVPLAQQRKAAASSLKSASAARAALASRSTYSPLRARWTIAIIASFTWLAVPALCGGFAAISAATITPAVWSALGVCWAMLATLTGTFSFASLPDTPRVARAFAVCALVISGLLFTGLSALLAWMCYYYGDA